VKTNLHGVIALVTGTTRGLGLALAQTLLNQGAHVVSLSRACCDELFEISRECPGKLTHINADLSERDSVSSAIASLSLIIKQHCEDFGPSAKTRLIHNAAIVTPIAQADKLTDFQRIEASFTVNIAAPIYLTAEFLQATTNSTDRRIMFISSGAGRYPSAGWGVYCATKAAMDRYAEVVHTEAHANLRVASVAPGVIDTPMQAQIRHTPASQFPGVARFESMHRDGVLAPANHTATQLITLLEKPEFGQPILDDIRNYS
jgi:benzil reductase ((S)-benzoin forming)